MEKRENSRKLLDPLHVTDIQAIDRFIVIARYGTLINASATGLLIEVQPKDLSPDLLHQDLTLDAITGDDVVMKIVEMSLEIDGKVVRARETTQGNYELAIDFAANAPAYWRECFADLLPHRGEFGDPQHAHLN